jgi:hypothetical protein
VLDVGGGVFDVVVVEADLADGDAAGVGGEGLAGSDCSRWRGGGFLGMDAGAGVDGGEIRGSGRFGDFEGAVHLVGAVADADGEDGVDAGGVGAGEDLREVAGRVHVEMGVRVDERCEGLRSAAPLKPPSSFRRWSVFQDGDQENYSPEP